MLRTENLRELTLEAPSAKGRPAHLSAASGLVRRGDFLYVIGDDELNLAVFSTFTPGPGKLVRLFEGELSADEGERQRKKPDLEALTTLPPFLRNPYGALLALGSGTGETRDRGFVWSLDAQGALIGFPRVVDLSGLYETLDSELTEMNIEGVAVTGERLALFHRGNSVEGGNVIVYLSLDEVLESLSSDFAVGASKLLEIRNYEIGQRDGVDLAFTDGDSLGDGSLVFTAAAEGHEGTDDDGRQTGSAVGIIDPSGELDQLELIEDESIKLEGVDGIVADRMVHMLLCSDADDPKVPSPLFSATLTL